MWAWARVSCGDTWGPSPEHGRVHPDTISAPTEARCREQKDDRSAGLQVQGCLGRTCTSPKSPGNAKSREGQSDLPA